MTRHQERNAEKHSEYRAWLATQPCCICGSHDVQLAHVGGVGVGLKHGDDDQIVPLCRECHENHDQTKGDFERPCWLTKAQWRLVIQEWERAMVAAMRGRWEARNEMPTEDMPF